MIARRSAPPGAGVYATLREATDPCADRGCADETDAASTHAPTCMARSIREAHLLNTRIVNLLRRGVGKNTTDAILAHSRR